MASRDFFPPGVMPVIDDYDLRHYDRRRNDMFGHPYPSFGVNLDAFNFISSDFRELTNAIKGVFIHHFGIPEEMIEVYVDGRHPYSEPVLIMKYERGDGALISEIPLHSFYRSYGGYGYGEISERITQAIEALIRRALTTPIEQPAKKKLDQIKFDLKDFKSWLEDEAEDEEFVNVFMEYFGEEIDEPEQER